MRRRSPLGAGLVLAALVAGAAPADARADKDTELILAELRQIQAQLAQLQRVQGELQEAVRQIVRRDEEQDAQLRKALVDTQTLLDQLEQDVSVLSARLDETNGRLGLIRQELQSMRTAQQPLVIPPTADTAGEETPTPEASAGATETAPVEVPVASGPGPVELYNQAYTDYTQGRYALALAGFKDVYTLYPDSDLADNAYYWSGECYMARRQYEQAIEAFDAVIRNYPNSNKLAEAYVKKAMALKALDRRAEAMQLLELVIQRFPRTPAERIARQELESLLRTQRP